MRGRVPVTARRPRSSAGTGGRNGDAAQFFAFPMQCLHMSFCWVHARISSNRAGGVLSAPRWSMASSQAECVPESAKGALPTKLREDADGGRIWALSELGVQ